MKMTPKLLSRCEPIIKYKDGQRLLMGYRRRSRSRKAGLVYMLATPKALPAVTLGDGTPTVDIVKELVAKAQAEIAAEKAAEPTPV